jgi:hypothetical protein
MNRFSSSGWRTVMAENVKVAVRCRPMSSREFGLGSKVIVSTEENRTILIANPKDSEDVKRYTFDYAYGTDSIQEKVYADLGLPIVTRALDGFNGTIFAYGQVSQPSACYLRCCMTICSAYVRARTRVVAIASDGPPSSFP